METQQEGMGEGMTWQLERKVGRKWKTIAYAKSFKDIMDFAIFFGRTIDNGTLRMVEIWRYAR